MLAAAAISYTPHYITTSGRGWWPQLSVDFEKPTPITAKPAGKAATARTYSRSISKATPAPTHRRFWKDRASTLKSCIGEIFWRKIAQVFESTILQAHCAEPRRRKHSLTTTECTQRRRPQSPKSHSWNEGEHLQIPNRINKTNTARWHWFMYNCFYKYLTLSW